MDHRESYECFFFLAMYQQAAVFSFWNDEVSLRQSM